LLIIVTLKKAKGRLGIHLRKPLKWVVFINPDWISLEPETHSMESMKSWPSIGSASIFLGSLKNLG